VDEDLSGSSLSATCGEHDGFGLDRKDALRVLKCQIEKVLFFLNVQKKGAGKYTHVRLQKLFDEKFCILWTCEPLSEVKNPKPIVDTLFQYSPKLWLPFDDHHGRTVLVSRNGRSQTGRSSAYHRNVIHVRLLPAWSSKRRALNQDLSSLW
jgi:hypothetical protein